MILRILWFHEESGLPFISCGHSYAHVLLYKSTSATINIHAPAFFVKELAVFKYNLFIGYLIKYRSTVLKSSVVRTQKLLSKPKNCNPRQVQGRFIEIIQPMTSNNREFHINYHSVFYATLHFYILAVPFALLCALNTAVAEQTYDQVMSHASFCSTPSPVASIPWCRQRWLWSFLYCGFINKIRPSPDTSCRGHKIHWDDIFNNIRSPLLMC